jgi:hypothetical protein
MKSTYLFAALAGLMLTQSGMALAGDAGDTLNSGVDTHTKGMVDVVTSPEHMVEDPAKGMSSDHPVGGSAEGVVTGTAKTGDQALEGAGEMVEGTGEILAAPIKAMTD